jgi:hypothetical protein
MIAMNRILYRSIVLGCLAVGILVRVWDFGSHPEGLQQDEASIAVEATSLYHYAVDRNGESFPVHFIAWGSGQNALYAYALMPLVPLGLSPKIIRLPMLLSGILTMLLVFGIARRLCSPSAALIALALIALNPWHVMLSRWALESNFLPFWFALAFYLLLFAKQWPICFILSCALVAVCFYAYGTAYLAMPLFLAGLFAWNLRWPAVSGRIFLAGAAICAVVSAPMAVFVIVNALHLPTMHLGLLTIPSMPSDPRFETVIGLLHGDSWTRYLDNFFEMAKVLLFGTDGFIGNAIPGYGCLFPGAIVFALGGLFLLLRRGEKADPFYIAAFASWVALGFLLGILQDPFINRINIIWLPLILCIAMAAEWLVRRHARIALVLCAAWVFFSICFIHEYFGPAYRAQMAREYFSGILPAIHAVKQIPGAAVCVTDSITQPYIYVELEEAEDPRIFLKTIRYENERGAFRTVEQLGRYSFGIQHCPAEDGMIYVLRDGEPFPADYSQFTKKRYGNYFVYLPRSLAGG